MDGQEFAFAPLVGPGPVGAAARAGGADELAAARVEAEAIRAMASAEGLSAGRAEAAQEMAGAAVALAAALDAARADALSVAERLELRAVELALELAEKVVGAAVAVDPALVVEAIRGALRGIVERERVAVLVHPDDLDAVRAAMDGVAAELGGIEHCEVQAERRVARGGAVVRTPDGDVDARTDTKLERAREVVEAALGAA